MALNQTVVSNPGATSFADGSNPTAFAGKQGETLTSDVHGKWYTAAYRGKVFWAGTAAAGTTIPITTTTGGTFVLHNPIGSGVNVELISYDMGLVTRTAVISTIVLGIGPNVLINPTTVTALTAVPALAGSGVSSVARCYSIATIVATTPLTYVMGHLSSTNDTAAIQPMPPLWHYEFDGRVNLSPGSMVHVAGLAAQTSATTQTFVWAEWPV